MAGVVTTGENDGRQKIAASPHDLPSLRVIARPVAIMSRATPVKLVQVMNELHPAFRKRLIEDAAVHRPEHFSEPLHDGLMRRPHINT